MASSIPRYLMRCDAGKSAFEIRPKMNRLFQIKLKFRNYSNLIISTSGLLYKSGVLATD